MWYEELLNISAALAKSHYLKRCPGMPYEACGVFTGVLHSVEGVCLLEESVTFENLLLYFKGAIS